jgi:ABC-type branched-subunit amino acid transport system ATPase component/branched-subunit amino acid ABC-type transport system permease component
MAQFLSLVVSGLVSGALYSLIGAGIVLIYSTTGTFNFGLGAIAFVCDLLFYELVSGLHWSALAAGAISVFAFAPALSFVCQRYIFSPLTRAGEVPRIVASIGLLVALPALGLFIVGVLIDDFRFSIASTQNVVAVGGLGPNPATIWHVARLIDISSTQLIILGMALVWGVVLWLILGHSKLGLQMRAAVDRPALAVLRGVNDRRTGLVAWALGFMLAATVGIVGGPLLSLSADPYNSLMFVGATAAVLGGFRSIPWAIIGGLALGVAENLVAGYIPLANTITGLPSSAPFLLLLIGLLVLRRRNRSAGVVSDSYSSSSLLPAARDGTRWRFLYGGCGFTVLALLVMYSNAYWQGFIVLGLAYGFVMLSFRLVTGIGGMLNLGQSAFVMFGALAFAYLVNHHVPPLDAGAIAVVSTAIVGCLIGLPALRLGSLSLALATLALAYLFSGILFDWSPFVNGVLGWQIVPPVIGRLDFGNTEVLGLFIVIALAIAAALMVWFDGTRLGRLVRADRSSPVAVSSVGLSVFRGRLSLFAISAALAAVGGVLLAIANTSVTSTDYPVVTGLLWLMVAVQFGIGRVDAAILAGLLVALAAPFFALFTSSGQIPSILFGLGAVGLAGAPDGIFSVAGIQGRKVHAWLMGHVKRFRTTEGDEDVELIPVSAPASGALGVKLTGQDKVGRGVVVAAERPVAPSQAVSASLRLVGLSAGYGDLEVLHGVSLDVAAGSATVLLGLNGAGKTTCVSAICGSGAVTVREGSIYIDGREVVGRSTHNLLDAGVLVVPEARGIFPGLTIEENLALTLGRSDLPTVYDRFPRLAERRLVAAGNLSGGEQQMLALAPAIVHRPRLLIADEPTLGLAPLIASEVEEIFAEIRQAGSSLLLVDEKPRFVLSGLADSVAVLELGRVTLSGPVDDNSLEWVRENYVANYVTEDYSEESL